MRKRLAVTGAVARRGQARLAGLIASATCLFAAGMVRADAPTPLGALGAWELDLKRSSFDEELLGPAPARETIVVTRDDGRVLAFRVELVEQNGRREVETVSAPLDRREGFGHAGAVPLEAHLDRLDANTLAVTLSMANGASNEVMVSRLQPDMLMLEEDMITIDGDRVRQTLYFNRVKPSAP